jgi:hypothetical protein
MEGLMAENLWGDLSALELARRHLWPSFASFVAGNCNQGGLVVAQAIAIGGQGENISYNFNRNWLAGPV